MPLQNTWIPASELMAKAADMAFGHKTTVYDAYFLALAESLGHSFVTADYRFYERVKEVGFVVRLDGI